mgnify:CR=1 FL=1
MNYHNRFPVKPLFQKLAVEYRPNNDPWGYCMSLFFDIAAETHKRNITPWEWEYSAGLGLDESSDIYVRQVLRKLSDKRLLKLGEFCHKLSGFLRLAGRDY